MIIRANEIYDKVAQDNNINIDVIQSIGNCVFQHLKDNLNTYEELAHELSGIGTFNLRFQRFENQFRSFKRMIAEGNPGLMIRLQNEPDAIEKNEKVLEKIKEYRTDKKTKREFRFQTIKSSEDKS